MSEVNSYTNRHKETYTIGQSVRIDGASWDGYSAVILSFDGNSVHVAWVSDKSGKGETARTRSSNLMPHENPANARTRVAAMAKTIGLSLPNAPTAPKK